MTHTHTVTVTECGAESVISLSDTHTHTVRSPSYLKSLSVDVIFSNKLEMW